jgi:Right handed beta helix region
MRLNQAIVDTPNRYHINDLEHPISMYNDALKKLGAYGFFIWKEEDSDGLYHVKNGKTGIEDDITPSANPSAIISACIDSVATPGDPVDILLGAGSNGFIWNVALSKTEIAVGNINFRGMGMGLTRLKIDESLGTNAAISIRGHVDAGLAQSTLTANAKVGATTVTVSSAAASNYAIGDYVLLRSNALWYASDTVHQAEIKRITDISGATISLNGKIHDTYTTANGANIKRILFLKNVHLSDLTIERNVGLTAPQKWLTLQFIDNLTVERVEFDSPTRRFQGCLDIRSCINFRVTNCRLMMQPNVAFNEQYGISIDGVSENGIIENCQGYGRFRHQFAPVIGGGEADQTDGPTRNITVSNCEGGWGNNIAIFDSHRHGEHIDFHNCIAWSGYNRGFTIRSPRTRLIDCSAIDMASEGIAVSEMASDVIIDNFHAQNCLDGIGIVKTILFTSGYIQINNPHIEYCTRDGIVLAAQADHTAIRGGQIHNNTNNGINVTSSNYLKVIGAVIRDNGQWGIKFTAGDCIKEWLDGNTILNNTSGTIQNGGQTGNHEDNITT